MAHQLIFEVHQVEPLAQSLLCIEQLLRSALHVLKHGTLGFALDVTGVGHVHQYLQGFCSLEVCGEVGIIEHKAPLAVQFMTLIGHITIYTPGG